MKFKISLLTALSGLFASPFFSAKAQDKITSYLEVIDVETLERTVVKEFPYRIEAPNWTSDGRWLVYNSDGKIFRIASDGSGEPVHVPTGDAVLCNNDHVLSPDGRFIAVSSGTPEDWKSKIYVVPIEGGASRLVTPDGPSYLHGWSPDGKTLAYCADRGGNYDVYTISVNPSEEENEVRLTEAEGLDDGPEYSVDGKYIWFNSIRSGLMQIWKMKADGSHQEQVTFSENMNSWFAHESPDGKKVAYIAYHKGDLEPGQHLPEKNVELMLMSSNGTNPVVLARIFGGQGSINVNSWAPDSKHLAFVSYSLNDQKFPTIGVEAFKDVASRKDVQLIDVRTAKEYSDGHVPGASNVDFYSRSFEKNVARRYDKSKPLAVYCRSGKRSAAAAAKLVAAGFVVYNLDGGFLAWQESGQKVEK